MLFHYVLPAVLLNLRASFFCSVVSPFCPFVPSSSKRIPIKAHRRFVSDQDAIIGMMRPHFIQPALPAELGSSPAKGASFEINYSVHPVCFPSAIARRSETSLEAVSRRVFSFSDKVSIKSVMPTKSALFAPSRSTSLT